MNRKSDIEGIFAQCNTIDMNVTVIRGVQYIVFSFFDGEKSVEDKVGGLIQSSFESTTGEEITKRSLLDSGMAIQKP